MTDHEITTVIEDGFIYDFVPNSYGYDSAGDSGQGVPVWYGSAEGDIEFPDLEDPLVETIWGQYIEEGAQPEEAEAWAVAAARKIRNAETFGADEDDNVMDDDYYNWSQPCDVCKTGTLTQYGDENDLWVSVECDTCDYAQDIKLKDAETFSESFGADSGPIVCPACGFNPSDMIFSAIKEENPDRNPSDVIDEMSEEEYIEEAEFFVYDNHVDYCPNRDELIKIIETKEFDAEVFKDSCCCGATTESPCACMKMGVVNCGANCPCSDNPKHQGTWQIQNAETFDASGELDDQTIEMFIARGYILCPNGDPTDLDCWEMPPVIRRPTGTATWKLKDAETFEAPMASFPAGGHDVKDSKAKLRAKIGNFRMKRGVKPVYITYREGTSNKFHVFMETNKGNFNAYGRIGYTPKIFGPLSDAEYHRKMRSKMRKGYRKTSYSAEDVSLELDKPIKTGAGLAFGFILASTAAVAGATILGLLVGVLSGGDHE